MSLSLRISLLWLLSCGEGWVRCGVKLLKHPNASTHTSPAMLHIHRPSPPSLPIRTRPHRAGIGRDRKKRHGQMAPSVGWRYHISALVHHAFWLQDQGSWALSVEPSQVCRQSVEHRESSLTIDAGQMHIILPKARAGSMPRTCRAGRCQFSRCSSSSKGDSTHSRIDARHDSVLPFCHLRTA